MAALFELPDLKKRARPLEIGHAREVAGLNLGPLATAADRKELLDRDGPPKPLLRARAGDPESAAPENLPDRYSPPLSGVPCGEACLR
jgi:hypothetical protein